VRKRFVVGGVVVAGIAIVGVGLELPERPCGAGCSLARAGKIIHSGLFKVW